jgi:hypothetical protein
MKLCALMSAYRLIIVISFLWISPFFSIECPSLSHLINLGLKSFAQDKYCYPCLFSGTIGLVNLPAFYSQSVLISVNEVGLL